MKRRTGVGLLLALIITVGPVGATLLPVTAPPLSDAPLVPTPDARQDPPAPPAPAAPLPPLETPTDGTDFDVWLRNQVAAYFQDQGYAVRPIGEFEENASLVMTHHLGDVDGDGYEDILADTFCNDQDGCRRAVPGLLGIIPYLTRCAWPHKAVAVSGRDGSHIWNRTLEPPSLSVVVASTCMMEFVVGTFRHGETNSVLVYRWETFTSGLVPAFAVRNTLYALDGKDGKEKWSYSDMGYAAAVQGFSFAGASTPSFLSSHKLLWNPARLPQQVGRTELEPNTLFVQVVGVNYTTQTVPAPPGSARPYQVFNSFQPDEYLFNLDLQTGKPRWTVATFQAHERMAGAGVPPHAGPKLPITNRSVLPVFAKPYPKVPCLLLDRDVHNCNVREPEYNSMLTPERTQNRFWGQWDCCGDLTGDGVPEPVFVVFEMPAQPMYNPEGPKILSVRLVVYDGASGRLLYERYFIQDAQAFFWAQLQPTLDVTGDGLRDVVLQYRTLESDFEDNLVLLQGSTGKIHWAMQNRRGMDVLPVNDVNQDGRGDFVYYEFAVATGLVTTRSRYAQANVSVLEIRAVDGATGRHLWSRESMTAPSDLAFSFHAFRRSGLLDLDADGAGDIFVDEPIFLPDLNVVHRLRFISTRTQEVLGTVVSVGVLAFPMPMGDLNRDNRSEFLLLNGDINDIWGTFYDGASLEPQWSRRLLAANYVNYYRAAPNAVVLCLTRSNESYEDCLVNFQLTIQHINFVFTSRRVVQATTTEPILIRVSGRDGTLAWSHPQLPGNGTLVPGLSPASALYSHAKDYSREGGLPAAKLLSPWESLASAGASTAFFLLALVGMLRRRQQ